MGNDVIFFDGIRKARKQHKCDNCSGEIPKGAEYRYRKGVWDSRLFTEKLCALCGQAFDTFLNYAYREPDNCIYYDGFPEFTGKNEPGICKDDDGYRFMADSDIFDDEGELIDD